MGCSECAVPTDGNFELCEGCIDLMYLAEDTLMDNAAMECCNDEDE